MRVISKELRGHLNLRRGRSFKALGDQASAEAAFKLALDELKDTESADYVAEQLLRFYLAHKQFDEAEQHLSLLPDEKKTTFAVVLHALRGQKVDRESARAAIEPLQDNRYDCFLAGVIYQALGQKRDAVECFRRFLKPHGWLGDELSLEMQFAQGQIFKLDPCALRLRSLSRSPLLHSSPSGRRFRIPVKELKFDGLVGEVIQSALADAGGTVTTGHLLLAVLKYSGTL